MRKANKKADMSLNVIIVAAIGLMVLVILAVIFIGRMGTFSKSSENCAQLGGTCYASDCSAMGLSAHPTGKCDSGQQCCIPRIG